MSSDMQEFADFVSSANPSIHDFVLDGSKVMFYQDRVKAWERGERIAPITMDVAWTRSCQAACRFCYATTQASSWEVTDPRAPKKITKDLAFGFLEDAAEIGVKGVSLISDGESTVVPWYAESVEYAAKCGLKVGIGSNGIALTRPVLEKILPHVSYLRFNFSGGEPKRYAQIMGVQEATFYHVLQNIKDAMEIKRRGNLPVTINMQLVLDPKDQDQLEPFGELAKSVRPTYAIVKHCADTVEGILGVNYRDYEPLFERFRKLEALSDDEFRMIVKWNRIIDGDKRNYSKCFGPNFILQMSGNGLIAPCGFLFNDKFGAFHIGSILETRFRDIFYSDRYAEVLGYLGSDKFNPQERCGSQCLQHHANDWLFRYKEGQTSLPLAGTPTPPHLEFI